MAENQVNSDKMAVSAVGHPVVNNQHEFNNSDHDSDRKGNFDANAKKKSCFQITRVVTKSGGSDQLDGEADEDLDETNTESFDVSKTNDTDFDQQSDDTLSAHSTQGGNEEYIKDFSKPVPSTSTPQATNNATEKPHTIAIPEELLGSSEILITAPGEVRNIPDHPHTMPQRDKPSESRFKVVKIESKEPFRRGRWSCQDYLDPPSDKEKTTVEEPSGHASGNSSTASSVHFIPGVDDPSRNPLADGSSSEFNSQSTGAFSSNGSHIGKNTTMPSQHVSNQVPSSMTQTHTQNVLPSSERGSHYTPGSTQASVSNGQTSKSQQSFSQASLSSQNANSTPQSQVQSETNSDFNPPQTNFIPNTARHNNAQSSQDSNLSQQVQSSTSQEFKNSSVQQNFNRTQQQGDIRNTPSNSDSVNIQSNDYPAQDTKYNPGASASLEKGAQQADASDQEPTENETSIMGVPAPLLEMVASTINHDEGGASTVAIDNKIAQAMDLVKSHLMYAVREEVDVLRAQIKELLDKNSQLEYENSILRQAASSETLTKLQQPRPPGGGGGGTGGGGAGTGGSGGGGGAGNTGGGTGTNQAPTPSVTSS